MLQRCFTRGEDRGVEENSIINMMWALTFLYILGINVCQATGEAKSMQMYYFKLTVDKSAFGNITRILQSFESKSSLGVEDLHMTTVCARASAHMECTCNPGYSWSDNICRSNKTCCGNKCTFPNDSPRACVSNAKVTVKGSVTMKGTRYQNCLEDKKTPAFDECNRELLTEMKKVYSTLRGFEALKISNYSVGSIIAHFVMTVNSMDLENLAEKSKTLSSSLSAQFTLVTTGVVQLRMPENPVKYNASHSLTCTLDVGPNIIPEWKLRKHDGVFKITNGTDSEIRTTAEKTTLGLKNTTELWAGEYTCVYRMKTSPNIIEHIARGVLDVALLPNIDITTVPQFPRCRNKEGLLTVIGACEVKKSNENYTVVWSSQGRKITITSVKPPRILKKTVVNEVEAVVSCNTSTEKPQLTCTYLNRRNQSISAPVSINIIYVGDQFCNADNDWGETKAGYTAVLKCPDAVGERLRECSGTTWGEEESECVNHGVNDIRQKAKEVDIGIGELDENAAQVFSNLDGVTYATKTINTFSNMKATVGTLTILSDKLNSIGIESTVNDFLDACSNLMNPSLNESWTDKRGNLSLAEEYLSSFEKLIEAATVNGSNKKTYIEVATCYKESGSKCTNTAFNVTVNFDSPDNGSVKTAGFQQLVNYFDNKEDKYKSNSIIVSTTTEKPSNSVKVEINFPLLRPRPRHVKLKCVSWDNTNRQWSDLGCEWKGSSSEGGCVCSHLSSFALLMSPEPIKLPWINEITHIGLSVSVASLVISLVIELTVWNMVVKTNTLYLRHTAHVNISLCLLIGHTSFLASSQPEKLSEIWCKTLVMLKHFFYLSAFFWMLCLSSTLLHQVVFLFHEVSKKTYLMLSLIVGYACPLLIVVITCLSNDACGKGYFSINTCWLTYGGLLKGSIYTFLIPIGIIINVNLFSMVVVVMKLVNHPMNTETPHHRASAKTILRTVVLLTPIFGVTWLFGLGVAVFDLTDGDLAFLVNYMFVLMNSFQGLFILLTTCLGDKLIRDALLKRLRLQGISITDSSTKFDPTIKE